MAEKLFPLVIGRSTSFAFASLSIIALFSAFFFYYANLSSSSHCLVVSDFLDLPHRVPERISSRRANAVPRPEYSFVASLDKFLTLRAPPSSSSAGSSPGEAAGVGAPAAAFEALDDSIRKEEERRLYGDPLDPWLALSVVRVYVYEMPAKFTYDLLWLFRNTYMKTVNLTSNGSPVHRLIEQHSFDYWLWADLISPESQRRLKNVVRVHKQEEADLFYIPFFTTISYFLLQKQECKALYREALKWVTDQPAWQRSGGRDHILPVHHPWSFKSVRRLMKKAIWLLPDMDSTGNWYKPGQVWLEKDLVLPYVPNVDLCDAQCLRDSLSKRSTLLFFRGRLKRNAGGKVRSKLAAALHNAKDVVMEEGSAGEAGKAAAQAGMRKSLFCLSPAGDTPSSARLFDAIVSGCIPVIVSDEVELPFEGILDYRKHEIACALATLHYNGGRLKPTMHLGKETYLWYTGKIALLVSSNDAVQDGWLINFLKNIDSKQIRAMQSNLAKYSRHFLYSSPAQPLGAEDLTWRLIAGKLVNIKLHTRRSQRMVEGSRNVCTCECRAGNITVVP